MDSTEEKTPEDVELNALLRNTYLEHSRYVFAILRAEELEKYYPAAAIRSAAYDALCKVLISPERADQTLDLYRDCEARRRIFKNARNDPKLTVSLEALRGMEQAPLMMELPTTTAYDLWARAGSWTGALALAGLAPLDDRQRQTAIEQFALENADPSMIPPEVRKKLSPKTIKRIADVFTQSRQLGRMLSSREFPDGLINNIQKAGFSVKTIFRYMGIKLTKNNKNETREEHQRKVQNFLNQSYGWRHGKKYLALMRGEKPPEKKQKHAGD
jgi:hypothetical protein